LLGGMLVLSTSAAAKGKVPYIAPNLGMVLTAKGLPPDLIAGGLPPTYSSRLVILSTRVLLGKLVSCEDDAGAELVVREQHHKLDLVQVLKAQLVII
jgi:hypothetical protein